MYNENIGEYIKGKETGWQCDDPTNPSQKKLLTKDQFKKKYLE